jgi:Uma2 family endonuclease
MAAGTLPKSELPTDWTLEDLSRHLGGIPLDRIRLYPPPGMAVERDLVLLNNRANRLFELVDGILVEKPMGCYESLLAGLILTALNNYLKKHKLGKALGADGALRILSTRIRIPDVSFLSWRRLPEGKLPRMPIASLVPDLAVEVLSQSNTDKEMRRKLKEYFQAGVAVVWYIDPRTRTARIFTSVNRVRVVDENGVLEAGKLLPGFALSLGDLFADADEEAPDPR